MAINEDNIDDLYTGTPTDEQWTELMEDPKFKEMYYQSMAKHPPSWISDDDKQLYKEEYKKLLEGKQ